MVHIVIVASGCGCGCELNAVRVANSTRLSSFFYPCCFLAPLQYAARDVVSREPSAESATFRILFYGNILWGNIKYRGPLMVGVPRWWKGFFLKRRNMREFERIPG
ncbi:hypothetical protein JTE90_003322 [Oedothorax gibbosus]|uniref:Secreted protein n=1 Tax=Oedothorax gibbosus TaxID=931172 RepID=A0AAV6TFL0_9ARAC|nr:hypothetical protein JTE90_003322 [Oedothorax gibbosus]